MEIIHEHPQLGPVVFSVKVHIQDSNIFTDYPSSLDYIMERNSSCVFTAIIKHSQHGEEGLQINGKKYRHVGLSKTTTLSEAVDFIQAADEIRLQGYGEGYSDYLTPAAHEWLKDNFKEWATKLLYAEAQALFDAAKDSEMIRLAEKCNEHAARLLNVSKTILEARKIENTPKHPSHA